VSVFASAVPTVVRATAAPQTCASWLPQVEWVAQSPLPAAQVPAAQLLQVLSPVAVPSVTAAVPAVRVTPATWLPHIVRAVQTLLLSQVPVPQARVQVVMVPAATGVVVASVPTVFFEVAVAHDPVAKRLSVADVQVYVTPVAAAPVTTLQAVHAPAD